MNKLLKRFFNNTPEQDVCNKQEDVVGEKKDISEPVFSFVKIVKENPKRFKLKLDRLRVCYFGIHRWDFKDVISRKSWYFSTHRDIPMTFPEFLTEDEKIFLLEELRPVFIKKAERYSELKEQRKQRRTNKERQKLIEIYCK